jgi:glycyl-tRNA synthetase beta chain
MHILGALFGVMDRFDFLVGAFLAGIEPTGSKDPYALRRAGGVVVKLIRAFDIPFSLNELLGKNVRLYTDIEGRPLLKEVGLKPIEFLKERVIFELDVKPGTRPFEILQAVTHSSLDNLADVFKRFEALNGMDQKVLIKAAKVIQRTANMLKSYGKTSGEPKQELLAEEQEKKLFELIRTRAKDITESLGKKEYERATKLFAEIFSDSLHDFFDHVLVNVEDPALRENRMALVAKINRLYTEKIADLSTLSRIDEE